jgi:hypothetical protein
LRGIEVGMKFYTISTTGTLLRIEKKKNRKVLEKFYVFAQTLILSIALGSVIYFSLPPSKRSYSLLLTIIVFISIILLLFFGKSLKEKAIIIELDRDNVIYNGRNIGKIDTIDSLLVEEYISAEAITGLRTIKLATDHDTILIAYSVNEVDYKEMVSVLQTFLNIPDSKLLEKIC